MSSIFSELKDRLNRKILLSFIFFVIGWIILSYCVGTSHWMKASFEAESGVDKDKKVSYQIYYGLFHAERCQETPYIKNEQFCVIWPITELDSSAGVITSNVKIGSQVTSAFSIMALIISFVFLPGAFLRAIRQNVSKIRQKHICLANLITVILVILCVFACLILYPSIVGKIYIYFVENTEKHYPVHKGFSYWFLTLSILNYIISFCLIVYDTFVCFKYEDDDDSTFYSNEYNTLVDNSSDSFLDSSDNGNFDFSGESSVLDNDNDDNDNSNNSAFDDYFA
eukprot:TRINITY_DN3059_c4_g1_i1.p1 TRINITY_DN3059_c4_g1~~TRINITY_DN3059_c4_g1_i1.p1  ORF type:complete len:282 (-),score=58.47 TRINITY_DN3059_c4_g1_i1:252-1097(-)